MKWCLRGLYYGGRSLVYGPRKYPMWFGGPRIEVRPRVKTIKKYFVDTIMAVDFDLLHKKAMTQFEGRSLQLGVRLHSMFLCLGLGLGPGLGSNTFIHTNFDPSNIIILQAFGEQDLGPTSYKLVP